MLQRYVTLFLLLAAYGVKAQYGAPLEYIKNNGQWSGPFAYKTITSGGDVFLENKAFTYIVNETANADRIHNFAHGSTHHPQILNFHAYQMSFDGALTPTIIGSKEQKKYYNYFLGNDSSKWKTGIHPDLALDYIQLYNGIDMHVSSQGGNLKYEFIVSPGASPDDIKLRFTGLNEIILKGGDAVLMTNVGDVKEMKPVVIQYINGQRVNVPCEYQLKGTTLSYHFPNGYDATAPLIIDPTVVFCTFTGSTADNWGFTATYDASGNFYAGGLVNGQGYPVTTGAFQQTYGGGSNFAGSNYPCDMGITKFDPTGSNNIYSTYIGGSSNDQPHSMIVEPSTGNLYIAGRTYSNDFPTVSGCYKTTAPGGADIVVVRLNSTGTALLSSTYMGGSSDDGVNFNANEYVFGNLKHNYGDDARSEILIDRQSNVYVAASTKSTNFPTTSNAQQTSLSGTQDAVVFKMDPTLSTLIYSTYLGGSSDDAAYVLGLDTGQNYFYVGGGTQSNNFPQTGTVYQNNYGGGSADGFIAKFQNSGSYPMVRSTFIGQSDFDQVYGIQIDLDNNVYAVGQTLGGTFPVSSGVYNNASSSQFVIKLDGNLQNKIYSTVFGSGSTTTTNISPIAFLVDTCQNVYISGWGGNLAINTTPATVGTTNGLPTTANPPLPCKTTTDGNDFYFFVLSKNAISLLFGAFYGRTSTDAGRGEHVDGGTSRFDKNGVMYQAICGGCYGAGGPSNNFPTTSSAYATVKGNFNCNLAALKIAFQLGAVKAVANANPSAKGCPPFTVNFQNGSSNASAYTWNYGDGTALDTSAVPTHTFYIPGNYNVRLVAYNPNACKIRDTAYLTVIVDSNNIKSKFTTTVTDSCNPYRAAFTNTSKYGTTPGSTTFTHFLWIYGDGTTSTLSNPGTHNFPDTGTYTVLLVMRDSTACNSPDTAKQIVHFNSSKVSAAFNGPPEICIANPTTFSGTAIGGTSYSWDFGDSKTSTTNPVTHTYAATGTYTVTLIVTNPKSCNKADTFKRTITVDAKPKAEFTWSPIIPVSNKPISFTDQSTNENSWLWNFGDGSPTTVDHNPNHLFRKTGRFLVCLSVKNSVNCSDTVCHSVDADIHPAVDVPTGFSPNGDGQNDILYVRGAAIDKLDFKVFNRWGQMVFQTNDINIGWDGTYKGKLQEIEAYAWVLHAVFIDGSEVSKQGNVTLLK